MDANPPRSRLLLRALGGASLCAVLVALAEVLVAATFGDALLGAMPPAERLRYGALLLVLFPVAAIPAALLGFAVATVRPRLGTTLAFALPALLTVEEALRHAAELPGLAPWILAGIAGVVALGMAGLALARAAAIPPRATLGALVVALVALPLLHSVSFGSAGIAPAEAEVTASGTVPRAAAPHARNLIVLLVDTMRADHLGCYGYARPTSPSMDAFAASGTLFENAATPKPKTSPAVASLFTGTWPSTHLVHGARTELVEENVTLAETLQKAGIATFGVSANININKSLGYGQGFDELRWVTRAELPTGERVDNHAVAVATQLMRWVSEHRDQRFFAYAHFIDPHSPYRPPPPYAEMFAGDALDGALGSVEQHEPNANYIDRIQSSVFLPEVGFDLDEYVALYDGEIRFTDEAIGATLNTLEQLGLADSTIVVVVSDHGESMVEHHAWFNHGLFPYEEQVHVPLMLRGPGIAAGQRRTEQVSLVGLMPTLLDLLGVDAPDTVEAGSFAGLLDAAAPSREGAPTMLSARYEDLTMTWGLRTNRWKYLFNPGKASPPAAFRMSALAWIGHRLDFTLVDLRNYQLEEELYDLQADPAEEHNVAYRNPALRALLRQRMEAIRAASRPVDPAPRIFESSDFTEEARRDLMKLGYMGK